MQVIKAPEPLNFDNQSVFLAGSIEMGKAIDWQTSVTASLVGTDITILNPRRDDWDSSWEQTKTNPKFKEQVLWELNGMKAADIILMYFEPSTKAPITLLELGLFADSGKIIVVCPNGFWRKGNVDVVCEHCDVSQVETLDQAVALIKSVVKPSEN
jgi:hypothetical protein